MFKNFDKKIYIEINNYQVNKSKKCKIQKKIISIFNQF